MNKLNFTYIILLFVLFTSCDEEFVEKQNPNAPTGDAYIFNRQDAEKALAAAYSKLQSTGLYANKYLGLVSSKSDLFYGAPDKPWYSDIATFTRTAAEEEGNEYTFINMYQGIWRANQVIGRLADFDFGPSSSVDVNGNEISYEKLFIAEATFLKGFYYFEALNYYGKIIPKDVLPSTTDDFYDEFIPTKTEAYAYIANLFETAAADLPISNVNGRVTRGTALAYLGKLNLYWAAEDQSKYADALTAFEEVLRPEYGYALTTDWMDNFTEVNEYNSESIFEIGFLVTDEGLGSSWKPDDDDDTQRDESNSQEQIFGPLPGHIVGGAPHAGWAEGFPSRKLLDMFEPGDPRRKMGIISPGDTIWQNYILGMHEAATDIQDARNNIFAKWLRANENDHGSLRDSEINRRVMRLADVYLMYAECLMKENRGAEAVEYINRVRRRVGAAPGNADFPELATNITTDSIYKAIIHERAVELFFEGQRFYDLMRWSKDPNVPTDPMAIVKTAHPLFQENKHEVAPIPQRELDTNSQLSNADQNPGY